MNFSFSIMALNCLLIETLQHFYLGIDETPTRINKTNYINFLTSRKPYKSKFNNKTARNFYKGVRCGILHQAQTKRNTQLTLYNPDMV